MELKNNKISAHARVIHLWFILSFIFTMYACSGFSVKEEKDGLGRTVRRVIYKNNKIECQEEVKYLDNSEKPLIKVYKKIIENDTVPWWMEVYSYNEELLSQIKFFISDNEKRILSGKIDYLYEDGSLKMIEYYSMTDAENPGLKRHGFDLYYYSNGVLINRRIIEYEYNPVTGDSMQVSQYVVEYKDDMIASLETRMLDRESKEMMSKNETHADIIQEMITNIEKSLRDRCIGKSINK